MGSRASGRKAVAGMPWAAAARRLPMRCDGQRWSLGAERFTYPTQEPGHKAILGLLMRSRGHETGHSSDARFENKARLRGAEEEGDGREEDETSRR